jgi:hypothetical protein
MTREKSVRPPMSKIPLFINVRCILVEDKYSKADLTLDFSYNIFVNRYKINIIFDLKSSYATFIHQICT